MNRAQSARVLLTQAKTGRLVCHRAPDLKPTFVADVRINEADRQAILRFVLDGALVYERNGPHGFGVGRLMLTGRGLDVLQRLPLPGVPATPGKAKAGKR